eukprot:TRINITY_DN5827_c0_g1_i1.p1 TRINITY_DN5827_c0_g1~~TRINITY_DN5827_c0_g1_i1.p1  ORF type:complete len:281 (-),score=55.05 TRINITY_DN5827_c0_g1_i1:93-902(-)
MAKFLKSVDLDKLQQPAIFVTDQGVVDKVNTRFCDMFGWKPTEIQKQNVSLIVSPKMVKKTAHDAKLKGYKLNKESQIIGKPSVLPVKNVDDEEVFCSVQIVPIGTGKSYCFLCFFAPVFERSVVFEDGDLLEVLKSQLDKCEKTENFRQNSVRTTEVVSVVKSFLEEEIVLITRFLYDNYMLEETWKLAKYLLWRQKRGKLQILYELMMKRFENPQIVYANLVCLRIIFPLLSSKSEQVMQKVVAFTQEFYNVIEESSSKTSGSKGTG